MKVLKNAQQHNVVLNRDYYLDSDIQAMLDSKEICWFDNSKKWNEDFISYSSDWYHNDCYDNRIEFRIFLEDVTDLKVVYNKEYGCYETVAVGKNGKQYHVVL